MPRIQAMAAADFISAGPLLESALNVLVNTGFSPLKKLLKKQLFLTAMIAL